MDVTSTAPDTGCAGDQAQLDRLLALRERLLAERQLAGAPAVDRSLEMADYYLFMALTYFGYTERLFPEQR